jgi:hypothetical protein
MTAPRHETKIKSTISVTIPVYPEEQVGRDLAAAILPTLYLHVDGHVEWSVVHAHAWGRGSVSSDPGGGTPFNIADVKLRILMNTPEQQDKTTDALNASYVDNDVVWASTNPIFSGPHTTFIAQLIDPRYKTVSAITTVY